MCSAEYIDLHIGFSYVETEPAKGHSAPPKSTQMYKDHEPLEKAAARFIYNLLVSSTFHGGHVGWGETITTHINKDQNYRYGGTAVKY